MKYLSCTEHEDRYLNTLLKSSDHFQFTYNKLKPITNPTAKNVTHKGLSLQNTKIVRVV